MSFKQLLAATVILMISCAGSDAQVVTTIAGTGSTGFSGDGGPAINAQLNSPMAVAVDKAGNVYVADGQNNCIREIKTNGTIVRIAGDNTGAPGYTGDGGPAISARLRQPTGLFVDKKGNLFIADQQNYAIRKIDSAGTITTVAGTGVIGHSGDNGPATAATLNNPSGVVVDSHGNIYITDRENQVLRKVDTAGIIKTIGGSGYLYGITVDDSDNVYFTDVINPRAFMLRYNQGNASFFAGTGVGGAPVDGIAATASNLWHPSGIAADNHGNVFISDYWLHTVRRVNTATGIISTVAGVTFSQGYNGDGAALQTKFNSPYGIATDTAGNIYVADMANNRVRKVANPLSVAQNNLAENVNVYPNPASGGLFYVSANFGSSQKTVMIELTDLMGRVILNGEIETVNGAVEKEVHFPAGSIAGLYLLKLSVDGQQKVTMIENR